MRRGNLEIVKNLLRKSRVDVNIRYGRSKNTLLHYASEGNNLEIVKYFSENHADIDVNLLNKFYESAVSIAAVKGYWEIVKLLLRKFGVNVNLQCCCEKNTLLHYASEGNSLEIVKYLLENHADIDVNLLNDDGDSALAIACKKGNLEIVENLLRKSGVDLNIQFGKSKNTLLHYASKGGNLEIVKYLLENHADIDINLLNDDGDSALAIASEKGNLEIVKLLLRKSGVNVNIHYGKSKNTLLHYASEGNNLEIVKYLLENHADIDVNLLNDDGDSAASKAAERGYWEIAELLLRKSGVDDNLRYSWHEITLLHYASTKNSFEIVKYVLEKLADSDVNLSNASVYSAICTAAQREDWEMVKLLLRQSGADVNARCEKNTLLHYASEEGNWKIVKYLLENHADIDVNLLNDDGDSALAIACKKGNLEIVENLLRKSGVDLNIQFGKSKNTLLHYASKGGNLEIVKYLLENHADIDINLLNDDGDSALAIASEKGNLEIVKLLLRKSGVNVNIHYGKSKNTLLHYASEGNNLEIVKYLLENHADIDVNLLNDDGDSALAIASEKGNLEIVKLLLRKSGVNVNIHYGKSKNTLLHYASEGNNLEIVKYLLENHADIDVNLLNDDGDSALAIACKKGNLEIVENLLRKSGVDLNIQFGKSKNTLLHYASKGGNLEIVKYLLENHADIDVNLLNDDGDSALVIACKKGNLEIVENLLRKSGVDLNIQFGKSKNTLLHYASKGGNLEIVKYLLESRADIDVNLLNDGGDSAVSIAAKRGNWSIAKLLLRKFEVDVNLSYGRRKNTLLHYASKKNTLEIVKYLLENHADIDISLCNSSDKSAISIAAKRGYWEIVKLLLRESGVDVNLRYSRRKYTLLHYASNRNNLKIVKYLLENHADVDVNLLNKYYDSAASLAAERGYWKIVKHLLWKSGVDVNLQYGYWKNTLLHYASKENNLEVVKYLLEKHADIDVNLLNDDGDSAASIAAERGYWEIVKFMLGKSGVDINLRCGYRKNTLLHYASNNLEIVKYLLENHADIDVNLLNGDGDSALALVCDPASIENMPTFGEMGARFGGIPLILFGNLY